MLKGHTLVTPGAYMRDYACGKCEPIPFYGRNEALKHQTLRDPSSKLNYPHVSQGSVRTCNIFWRPQVCLLEQVTTENFNTSSV